MKRRLLSTLLFYTIVVAIITTAITIIAVLQQIPMWKREARSNILIDEAQALAAQGRAFESQQKVKEAYDLCPENPRVHRERGLQLMTNRKIVEGTTELRIAAEMQPYNTGAAWELAFALSASGQMEESIQWFQRVTERERRNGAAYAMIAQGLIKLNRVQEGMAMAQLGVSYSPRVPLTQFTLGLARWKAKDFTGAKAALEEALRLRPSDVKTVLVLAAVTGEMGRTDWAAQYLTAAVRIKPRDAMAWTALGKAHFIMGHRAQAQQAFTQALAINPNLAEAQTGLTQAQTPPN